MKKRSFWHYFTGGFLQFFDTAHSLYASITTFATLSVLVVFLPYVTLGLFVLALCAGTGIVTYNAVQRMREDERIYNIAKAQAAIKAREDAMNQESLTRMLALALAADEALQIYADFTLLTQTVDELLRRSTEERQIEILAELDSKLGQTWRDIPQLLEAADAEEGARLRLFDINRQLQQTVVQHLIAATTKPTIENTGTTRPAALTQPATMNTPPVGQASVTAAEDTAARKRSLWFGVKTSFGTLALFVAAISVTLSIIAPPVGLAMLLLPLAAVGVTVLVTSLAIGIAAAYYDYHVIQPKLREQQQIMQQQQRYEVLNRTLLTQAHAHRDVAEPIPARQTDTVTVLTTAKNSAKQAFKHVSHSMASIATAIKTVFADKNKPSPVDHLFMAPHDVTSTRTPSVATKTAEPHTLHQLESKPKALTEPLQEPKAPQQTEHALLYPNAAESKGMAKIVSLPKRRWPHYLGAGLFQFINKASSYYSTLSFVGVIIAVAAGLLVPYALIAAFGITLLLSAGTVMYYSVKAKEADEKLDVLVNESRAIEARQRQLQQDIHAHRVNKQAILTHDDTAQTRQINAYAELSLLVRALENFLRTQTHDEREVALSELNHNLGQNWQDLQVSFKNNTQDETTVEKVIQANTDIKAFLDSHVSADMRETYLKRHPMLAKLVHPSAAVDGTPQTKASKAAAPHDELHPADNRAASAKLVSNNKPSNPKRAAGTGFKTGLSSLSLLVAGATIAVSILFPPAVIPAIVVPLVCVGAGLLLTSIAVGVASAFHDYHVVQPKERMVEQIKAQHQQYKTLEPKLENIEKNYKAEEKALTEAEAQHEAKTADRLEAVKHVAQDAVKRLAQDFKSMIVETKTHFQSKKVLPDFDFISMRPKRELPSKPAEAVDEKLVTMTEMPQAVA